MSIASTGDHLQTRLPAASPPLSSGIPSGWVIVNSNLFEVVVTSRNGGVGSLVVSAECRHPANRLLHALTQAMIDANLVAKMVANGQMASALPAGILEGWNIVTRHDGILVSPPVDLGIGSMMVSSSDRAHGNRLLYALTHAMLDPKVASTDEAVPGRSRMRPH